MKRIKSGILMGVLNNFLTILLPFTTRTLILYKLGTEYLGLGGLFTSILQILSLSELGLGGAIAYSLYKPIAEHDINHVNAILRLYRNIYRVIGIVMLIIALLMTPVLRSLISGEVPEAVNIYVLYYIYVFNTVISYLLFAYEKVLLNVNQRYDIEVTIGSVTIIFQYLIQIISLLIFSNYYYYIVILPIMTMLNNIICHLTVKKMFPMYFCHGKVSKDELLVLKKNVSGAFCSKLGSTIYLSADNIVISAFLGLTILGKYGNYYYIISSLIAIFAVVHNSVRPVIGNAIVTKSLEDNWEKFKNLYYVYMWITIFGCSLCAVLYQPFETIWGGHNNLLPYSTVILLVFFFYVTKSFGILTVYQEAAGIWWHGKFVPLLAAFANLAMNIILVNLIGLNGVLISSIVSCVFILLPGTSYILFKHLFSKKIWIKLFFKMYFIITLKGVLMVSVNMFASKMIDTSGVIGLIERFALCMCICLVLYLLLNFKTKEHHAIIDIIKKQLTNKIV